MLHDSELMWNKIYSLPFQVALDTYTRDFQYKILNEYYLLILNYLSLNWLSHLYAHSVIRTRKPLNIFLFFVNILKLSGKKSLVGYMNAILKRFLI